MEPQRSLRKLCVFKTNILIKIFQEISFHGVDFLVGSEVIVEQKAKVSKY